MDLGREVSPDLAAEIDALQEDEQINDELERLKSELEALKKPRIAGPWHLAHRCKDGSMVFVARCPRKDLMEIWKFMFVPTILFLVIVAPMWITMHYRSVNRSSRSLSSEDRESIEHMLETVDKLTDSIGTLESILDADHPEWRQQVNRQERASKESL